MALIFSNMSLEVLEARVKSALKECEIWGDLNISEDEYHKLNIKLKGELGDHPTATRLKLVMNRYNVLFATDIVNYVLYEYDKDFWGGWASRFNISLPLSSYKDIGEIIIKTFEAYRYDIIAEGGNIYVTPILCQAGMPLGNYDEFFDILDSTLEISSFIPKDLIDELIGYRSYLVGSPEEQYYRIHHDNALDLIIQIREMMQQISGKNNFERDNTMDFQGIPEHIVKRYLLWKSKANCSNCNSSRKLQHYLTPKLIYDDTCKGVCLLLPGQALRNQSIYKLEWKIVCENQEATEENVGAKVNYLKGKICTNDVTIPATYAESYKIELWDDLGSSVPLQTWNIRGLSSGNPYLIFDYKGLLVSEKQIPQGNSLLILEKRTKVSVMNRINKALVVMPMSWSQLEAYTLTPKTLDGNMTIQTQFIKVELSCKNYFDIELLSNGTLFGEKNNYKEIPVFTSWPSLQIGKYSEYPFGKFFYKWQIVLKHQGAQKKSISLLSALMKEVNKAEGVISIGNFADESFLDSYGTYDLILYEGKTLKKYFCFSISPNIIPFKKSVRKVQWSFWNESENSIEKCAKPRAFYDTDFESSNWWLSLHFADSINSEDLVELLIETSNKEVIQKEKIVLNNNGDWATSINKFQTTIEGETYFKELPLSMVLHVVKGEEEHRLGLAIIREKVILSNPKYAVKGDKCIIYWHKNDSIVNKKIKLTSFNNVILPPIEYDLVNTRRVGENLEGIILEEPLASGTYYVDTEENIEAFTLEGETYTPPVYNFEHILHVNRKSILDNFKSEKLNLLVNWLAALAIAMDNLQWLEIIEKKLISKIEKDKIVFEYDKCEKPLIMLLINTGYQSNLHYDNKMKIRSICALINNKIISDVDRGGLLKATLESDLSEENSKFIIAELQLYNFKCSKTLKFSKDIKEKLWDMNRSLAVLVNLRSQGIDRAIDFEKIEYYLNPEVLEKIINIEPATDCAQQGWHECVQRIIRGKCKCKHITLDYSNRVWGDVQEFLQLFVEDKGNWKLQELETAESEGYEFMGKNYLSIIYEIMKVPDEKRKIYTDGAKKDLLILEKLVSKYSIEFPQVQLLLKKRLNGGANDDHRLFYYIGCASYLQALATKGIIKAEKLKDILPFWKNIMCAFPELAYRDIILSEIYVMFENDRD